MINFRQKHEQAPSALILGSLIVLVITFGFYLWVLWVSNHPSAIVATVGEKKLHELQMDTTDLKNQETAALSAVGPKVWSGDVEMVSASVLAQITAQSKQQNVTITSFRPSKATAINGVTELPITLQLSGSYSGIHAVLSSIDAPTSRVVLQSVQLSSGQASKGVLTANVGVTAFINSPPTDDTSLAPNQPVASATPSKGGKKK